MDPPAECGLRDVAASTTAGASEAAASLPFSILRRLGIPSRQQVCCYKNRGWLSNLLLLSIPQEGETEMGVT